MPTATLKLPTLVEVRCTRTTTPAPPQPSSGSFGKTARPAGTRTAQHRPRAKGTHTPRTSAHDRSALPNVATVFPASTRHGAPFALKGFRGIRGQRRATTRANAFPPLSEPKSPTLTCVPIGVANAPPPAPSLGSDLILTFPPPPRPLPGPLTRGDDGPPSPAPDPPPPAAAAAAAAPAAPLPSLPSFFPLLRLVGSEPRPPGAWARAGAFPFRLFLLFERENKAAVER